MEISFPLSGWIILKILIVQVSIEENCAHKIFEIEGTFWLHSGSLETA
jgi:hypothetical protein